jgi:mannose-6-phosphate isomerase-like protein (cupin superfamily)
VNGALPAYSTVNIEQEFEKILDYWSPRVVAQLNGQYVKLARVKGELVWHSHIGEDELFFCQKGKFGLKFRGRPDVFLSPGDMTVVPKGIEHLPYTIDGEAWLILFEPMATAHTGDAESTQTRSISDQLSHLQTA